jgi:hypothetical protein
VSMDVIFREHDPYFSSGVFSPFGDSLDTGSVWREGESSGSDEFRTVSVGDISYPVEMVVESIIVEPVAAPVQLVVLIMESVPVVESTVVPAQDDESKTQAQGELRVYTRRGKEPVESFVPRPLSLSALTPETPSSSTTDPDYPCDMIPLSTPPTPLSVRRTTRSNARITPDRYGFYPDHDITHHVSYSHISPSHGAFIASLDIISLPKCWQDAKLSGKRPY